MKTFVVLGAGLGAVPVIHALMANTVLKSSDWKLVVVTPNTHLHFPLSMPRVVIPGKASVDKVLASLELQFKDYPSDKFELVQATATALDPEAKTVTATPIAQDAAPVTISYDKLLIATGNRASSGFPWKHLDTTEETRQAVAKVQDQISKAKTIVVGGGGPTGVELVGELGAYYASNGSKTIHFVHRDDMPLKGHMLESNRKIATAELKNLKVNLISDSNVEKITTDGSSTVVEVKNASGDVTSLTADMYIPTVGLVPNTSFVPAGMLDSNGLVKQSRTMQVDGHPDLFVIGDAGSLEISRAIISEAQAKYLARNLPAHLNSGTDMPPYKLDTMNGTALSIGPNKGAGEFYGYKAPGLLIWFLKSRQFMFNMFAPIVNGKKLTV